MPTVQEVLDAFDSVSGSVLQVSELRAALLSRGVDTADIAPAFDAALNAGALERTALGGLRKV